MIRSLLIAASALALGACASLAPYGPRTGPGGQGFSEQRIESDRFRVSYRAVGAPVVAYDRALLRAAELTLGEGYDWFEVTQRYTNGRPDSAGGVRPSLSIGYGGGSGRYGSYRYSGSGVGVGVGLDLSGPSPTETTLEVRLGRGEAPDSPSAYDARELTQTLGRMVF